jgi:RNA polymerase sigma factor (sigma-70 family)
MAEERKRGYGFPSTHWSLLDRVKGDMSPEQRAVLDVLIRRYRQPVYAYLRRRGAAREDAEDLVQQFFSNWLARGLFGRADRARGRFRDFLLTSLRNFVANEARRMHALRRRPEGGFTAEDPDDHAGADSPAANLGRAHTAAIVREVLAELEAECERTGKAAHYEVFKARIVLPSLEGAVPIPLRDLGARLGLSQKQAANCLLTARRAYRRLLEAKISEYAASPEDAVAELNDLGARLAFGSDRAYERLAQRATRAGVDKT